ncbi:MAG TPA: alginate lyase family protein [Sphingomonas sp.]|uniref:alginate lyase family protein n=1 Tax=Sphingomonas sp. TaxID=28214 RepID=UPI002C24FD1F|nr:alginate lyase family protein [Sphingomonas sp.]HMI20145.1 alginate lyase family protein [Sphingomonas sp.]
MRRWAGAWLAATALTLIGTAVAARAVETPLRCHGADGYAASFGGRRTFLLDPAPLLAAKQKLKTDPAQQAAYQALIRKADLALARAPGSVVTKTIVPPSGDKHDYTSLAPYWWPDPSKADGLPYLRKDGEINPARSSAAYDRTAIEHLSDDVRTLSLAYYYSDDPKYAAKTASIVRVWFLDPATAMNPNMNYAQAVPGRELGRAEGVLDSSGFQAVVDGVGLIAPSGALSRAEQTRLEAWFGRYVDWMQASANGKAEDAARNNHGMWFDAQLAGYALFARRPDLAERVATAFPSRRIDAQFNPSGRLPEEMSRTRSLHYSVYALDAAYDVAEIGGCLGRDIWNYAGPGGRGLLRATDYVLGYRSHPGDWPGQEIRPDWAEVEALGVRAARAWPGRIAAAPADVPQ